MSILTDSLENLPPNKSFGLFFSLIFFIFFLYLYYIASLKGLSYISILLSLLFLTLSFIYPKIFYFLNVGWMIIAITLSKIMNPIILGIIFYLLITPTALLGKILGRDELKLKERKTESYWIERKKRKVDLQSFINQF